MDKEKSLERVDSLQMVKRVDDLLPTPEVIQTIKTQAAALKQSGMLPPGYKSEADVFVVALAAREIGVSFGRAMRGMFPMKGRIGFMGNFGLGLVEERCPGSFFTPTEWTAERCTVQCHRGSWKADRFEEVTFTLAEAKAAGWDVAPEYDNGRYVGMKAKAPWKNPKVQLYWRCVGFLLRAYFDDIFGGAFYTADEIADIAHDDVPADGLPQTTGAPYETAAEAKRKAEEAKASAPPAPPPTAAPTGMTKDNPAAVALVDAIVGAGQAVLVDAPLPPDFDEQGRRIDAKGNLIPEEAQPEIEFGTPQTVLPPGPTFQPGAPSTPEVLGPDKSKVVDEALVAKFVSQASKCVDKKSLDRLHEDYKVGANSPTLTKLFRAKQDQIARLASPTPVPSRS